MPKQQGFMSSERKGIRRVSRYREWQLGDAAVEFRVSAIVVLI